MFDLLLAQSGDPLKIILKFPPDHYMYLKATTASERQQWVIALGSSKACLTLGNHGDSTPKNQGIFIPFSILSCICFPRFVSFTISMITVKCHFSKIFCLNSNCECFEILSLLSLTLLLDGWILLKNVVIVTGCVAQIYGLV